MTKGRHCYGWAMISQAPPRRFDSLYEDVLSLLTAGTFRPGDRIVIKDLATQLSVSTTPLRETLARLAGRGVIEERRLEGLANGPA
jgi:DNA-binding GntR family transcriptional regulator